MSNLKLFSVNPGYGHRKSRYHHVVAAIDEIDAARQTFDILKPGWKPGSARLGHRQPTEWWVSRVFTPEEFKEEVGHLKFDDELDEDTMEEGTFGKFSEMLYAPKLVRL